MREAKETPLISCVVPVFNTERYLAEALDSIFAQTYRPLEVVVVDDGSTDGTAAVIARYGDRVRAIWQANAGPAAARNCGVRATRGDFVAFLDADDVWHADKLARQMARFAEHPEIDLCFTWARNFWIPELEHEAAQFREHRIAGPLPGYLAATLVARRSVFDLVGLFDSKLMFSHSTDWFLRAEERGCISDMLTDVLYGRRLHHENHSRQLNAASRDEYLALIKGHLDRQRAARQGNGVSPDRAKKDGRR